MVGVQGRANGQSFIAGSGLDPSSTKWSVREKLSIGNAIECAPAGHDQIVSTPAIDEFAIRLRAGSHLIVPGSRHELLMEQDRFRAQVLAAFDAFVPGTPIYT